jgi:hypothetical protein
MDYMDSGSTITISLTCKGLFLSSSMTIDCIKNRFLTNPLHGSPLSGSVSSKARFVCIFGGNGFTLIKPRLYTTLLQCIGQNSTGLLKPIVLTPRWFAIDLKNGLDIGNSDSVFEDSHVTITSSPITFAFSRNRRRRSFGNFTKRYFIHWNDFFCIRKL